MPQDNAALWLAEEWSRQFTRTMESMTGESVLMTLRLAPRREVELLVKVRAVAAASGISS